MPLSMPSLWHWHVSASCRLGIGLLSTVWPSVRRQESIGNEDVRIVLHLAADDPVDRDGVERCVASGCDEEATEDPGRDIRVEQVHRHRCARAVGAGDRVEQNIDRLSCADRVASRLGVEHLRIGRGELFALHAEVVVRRAGLIVMPLAAAPASNAVWGSKTSGAMNRIALPRRARRSVSSRMLRGNDGTARKTPSAPVRAIEVASGPSLLVPGSQERRPATSIPSLRAARMKYATNNLLGTSPWSRAYTRLTPSLRATIASAAACTSSAGMTRAKLRCPV